MAFVSLQFLIFFFVVFILFYAVKEKYRVAVLFVSSLFFIASFSTSFLVYAFLFTTLNFIIGKSLSVLSGDKRRNLYYVGQLFNIGGLVFYKYINFLLENINYSLNFFTDTEIPYLNIFVPVGISYYTFQGISYLYLIFKAKDKPESNFIHFGVYMLFFPKVMAGPIERHRRFLPQFNNSFKYNYSNIVEGGRLVLFGLLLKVVIGDSLGMALNNVYGNISNFSSLPVFVVFIIQPAQIYCDFAGYTSIAIGLGKIFGFQLSENFRRPFLGGDISGFWKRWHISLTSWCNDFIFNRILIKRRKWKNWAFVYAVFITFLIVGVWHGANWTYVILGLIQVVILTLEFFTLKRRKMAIKKINKTVFSFISFIYVYLFIAFSMIFFFSKDMNDAMLFLKKLAFIGRWRDGFGGLDVNNFEFVFSFLLFVLLLLYEFFTEEGVKINRWFLSSHRMVRWGAYLLVIVFVIYFSKNQNPFKYVEF